MQAHRILLALGLVLTVSLAGCTKPADDDDDGDDGPTRDVTIQNLAFTPAEITIEAGTTVIWTNLDSFYHTVTADDNSFDSEEINAGKEYSRKFDVPGVYAYHCTPHANMMGTITVTNATV